MIEELYLDDALRQLRKYRTLAEQAMEQTSDEHFFRLPDPEANSIALLVKHLAGNMRSRWTSFLTTDGEKPDRERDREFVVEADDTREALMVRWKDGWSLTLEAIEALRPDDLERTVTIRGEPHRVLEAINRQVTHCSYHVGQIVYLAKHFAGPRWTSLSIPRGRSHELDVARDGSVYRATSHPGDRIGGGEDRSDPAP